MPSHKRTAVRSLVAFDLDDTLYKERDYLRSGHRAVARALSEAAGADEAEIFALISANHPRGIEAAIARLLERGCRVPFTVDELVEVYRGHRPEIELSAGVADTLAELKRRGHILALITDGSSRHQRAKINALGLGDYIDDNAVFISEETGGDKHTPVPFALAEERFGALTAHRFYIGDNLAKDFHHPNLRGWTSVMLLDTEARNVFAQRPLDVPPGLRPRVTVGQFSHIISLV